MRREQGQVGVGPCLFYWSDWPRQWSPSGKDGTVIARFKSGVTPEDLKSAIEAALAAWTHKDSPLSQDLAFRQILGRLLVRRGHHE